MTMKKNMICKLHYTIVEMMMVVAVFMIILSMAIAAWSGVGSQAKTRNAARELSGVLNLARAKAIAERTYVGVLLSTNGSSSPSNELAADSASSDPNPYPNTAAARIYYCESNGTRSGYVDFEDWHRMPGGITFDFPASFPANFPNTANSINLYSSNTEAQNTTACIVFDRMGRVIYSRNMTVANGGFSISVVAGSTANNSIVANSSYYVISVNPYTGRVTSKYYEPN